MAGDTAEAKAAYNDFLTLWKDADPDIPIPKQAKAEYTNLQSQPWPVLSIDANRRLRSKPGCNPSRPQGGSVLEVSGAGRTQEGEIVMPES
jgi:hypothetical protein